MIKKVFNKILVLIVILTIGFTFQSCNDGTFYTESVAIPGQGWSKDTTFIFSPQIENTAASYNIYAWVRHSKNYKYSNLWIKLISDPNLTSSESGLIEIPIADKTGRWLGECTQSMCTKKILVKENYRFQKSSAFKVEVAQYMREDILKEVKNVGLELELIE